MDVFSNLFSSVLEELKSHFKRDFWLGIFLPILLFVGINLALYFEVFQEGLGKAFSTNPSPFILGWTLRSWSAGLPDLSISVCDLSL